MGKTIVPLGDQLEVSYTCIELMQENYQDALQRVATAINVQLKLGEQKIPFIPNDDFETTEQEKRIFLYGPSGCGKSRSIFEIIREKHQHIKKIWIINPRAAIGKKSGREDLSSLISLCGKDDLVVWDNFPDGLIKNDRENIRKTLGIVCLENVKHLLIALKPRYLETLRGIADGIPNLFVKTISYNEEKIKEVIRWYGQNIVEFNESYNNDVIKNEEKISKLLWQKEPIPLTVLDYFKELKNKKNNSGGTWVPDNAVILAKESLRRDEYYEYQFELIKNSTNRSHDAEFLYALKLCYELGLARTGKILTKLQRGIFGSILKKPNDKLDMWIYSSGQYYSMHDVPKAAIVFDEDIKTKVIHYLSKKFSGIIGGDNDYVYLVGLFLGNNIKSIPEHELSMFLMDGTSDIQNTVHFEKGFGHGIGENFNQLNISTQNRILDRANRNVLFTRSLGESLGRNFITFSNGLQKQIFQQIAKNPSFSRGLGIGLGSAFLSLPKELQTKILVQCQTNVLLADGLGIGLGNVLEYLSTELRIWMFEMLERNGDFARGMGEGLGQSFALLSDELHSIITSKIQDNPEFARGLGMGLGGALSDFPKQLQKQIFLESELNGKMSNGLGIGIGVEFVYLAKEYQNAIFGIVERDNEFADGLGLGLSYIFNYLTNEQRKILQNLTINDSFAFGSGIGYGLAFHYFHKNKQEEIFEKADDSTSFARGLGDGLGYNFGYHTREFREFIFKKAKSNNSFEIGLGYSLGRTYLNQPKSLKNLTMKMTNKSDLFALGSGEGFGSRFGYFQENLQEKLFEIAEKHDNFAKGLGIALGHNFPYGSREFQEKMFKMARKNRHFAEGFGAGLGRAFKYLPVNKQESLIELVQKDPKLVISIQKSTRL